MNVEYGEGRFAGQLKFDEKREESCTLSSIGKLPNFATNCRSATVSVVGSGVTLTSVGRLLNGGDSGLVLSDVLPKTGITGLSIGVNVLHGKLAI